MEHTQEFFILSEERQKEKEKIEMKGRKPGRNEMTKSGRVARKKMRKEKSSKSSMGKVRWIERKKGSRKAKKGETV